LRDKTRKPGKAPIAAETTARVVALTPAFARAGFAPARRLDARTRPPPLQRAVVTMTDITPWRLVLWGVGTSRTVRAHWALHELDLDYECRAILPRTGETQTAEYTKLNPRQKIPLLQDGDFKIAESSAIAPYLSNTYGTRENALIPTNPREHATLLEWCFYVATELDATSLYVMRRHGDLKHIYGEAPVALESAAAYFEK
jgi:glutathione S-transferase